MFYHTPLKASPGYFFIIFHCFQQVFICVPLYQPLEKISLNWYLASNLKFSPIEIYTHPQLGRKTQAGRVFSSMVWCLGRCAYCKGENFLSKSIHVIEWSLCVCTHIPSFLYLEQILLSLPAARISSNSWSNIPRCNVNAPILLPPLPKMIFAIHIWASNLWEPPQVSSLMLTHPFVFT